MAIFRWEKNVLNIPLEPKVTVNVFTSHSRVRNDLLVAGQVREAMTVGRGTVRHGDCALWTSKVAVVGITVLNIEASPCSGHPEETSQ